MRNKKETNHAQTIGALAQSLQNEYFATLSQEKQQQYEQVQIRKTVFTAWNKVLENTQESQHVTGLYYLEKENKLLIYLDNAAWAQEIYLMREIIRARMETHGVFIRDLVCRVSKTTPPHNKKKKNAPPQQTPAHKITLTTQEKEKLKNTLQSIPDQRLANALYAAEKENLQWESSQPVGEKNKKI